jgi:tetratricopeptide (TPR) repeat protein/O-antigen ligase
MSWLFWDPGGLYPYLEAKTAAWALSGSFLCLLWLILARRREALHWLDAVWLFWVLASTASLAWLPDARIGLPDLGQRILVAMAYPLLRWLPPAGEERLARCFQWTLAATLEIQAVTVSAQWIQSHLAGLGMWDNTRLVGTMGYHTFVASFAVVAVPFVVTLWPTASRAMKVVLAFILVHVLAMLLVLQSRSAWVALLLSMGILFVLRRREEKRAAPWKALRAVHWGILAGLALLVMLSVVASRSKVGGMWDRTLEDLAGEHITGRRLIWLTAAEMLRDQPVVGRGLGGFYYDYIPYQGRAVAKVPMKRVLPIREMVIWAHDEYLQEWVETGMAGLAGLLTLVAGACWLACRGGTVSLTGAACGASLAAWSAVALFDFPLHRPAESVLFFAVLGLAVRLQAGRGGVAGKRPVGAPGRLLALLCLLAFCAALPVAARQCLSLRALNRALKAPPGIPKAEVEASFRNAIGLSVRPGQAEAALGAFLCQEGRRDEGISLLQRSLSTFRDTNIFENLGKALADSGRKRDAVSMYRMALASGVRYVKDAAALARLQWDLGEREEAVSRLESLRILAPKNTTVAVTLAGIYYASSDVTRSLATVEPLKDRSDPQLLNLRAATLIRLGRVEEAREQLLALTSRSSDYVAGWNNLGALEMARNEPQLARAAFERVLALEPSNALARHYLVQIEARKP